MWAFLRDLSRRVVWLARASLLRRTVMVLLIAYALTAPAVYLVDGDQERALAATQTAARLSAARADLASLTLGLADQRLALDRYAATADAAAAADFVTGQGEASAAWRAIVSDGAGTGLASRLPTLGRAMTAWQAWAQDRKRAVDADRHPVPDPAGDGDGARLYAAFRQSAQVLAAGDAALGAAAQQASDSLQRIAIRDHVLVTAVVLALVSVVVVFLLGTTVRAMGRLAAAARQLSNGVHVSVPYADRQDEVGHLARSLANWQAAEAARWAAVEERNVLLEQAPIGICRLDAAGRIVAGNRAMQALIGWSPDEAVGHLFVDLLHAGDRAREAAAHRLLAEGSLARRTAETRFVRPDGAVVWCASATTPLRTPEGRLDGFIMIVEDISERRRQAERAAQIQRQLLPLSVPEICGYEMAGACLPAEDVAGDFYDWVVSDDGQVDLTVADVMGKGVGAALLMAALRTALRSARPEAGPADQLTQAALAMPMGPEDEGLFATVFHAHLDTGTGVLRYVDAGHGFCAIRRASGDIAPLPVRSLPVGAFGDEPFREGTAVLEPSDTLLVYTDGLVETPDRMVPVTDFAPDLDRARNAGDVVRRLMARMPDRPADDVTMLVVRRLAEPDESEPTPVASVELDVVCEVGDQLDLIHDALARFWQILRPMPAERWRMLFELAVAEVAANVVEHARPTIMSLRLSVEAGFAVAAFTYDGPGWTDLPPAALPDPMAERGRGLFLAKTGVDEVVYQRSGMTVSWRLLKLL
jgi:PAS domain S-box-containing protein